MIVRHLPFILLACLASGLAATSTLAQDDFTEADLEGRHAFLLSWAPDVASGFIGDLHATGYLEFDGAGNVSGRRILRRQTAFHHGAWGQTWEEVDQVLSGTVALSPDGTAVMEISADPNPPWLPLESSLAFPIDLGDAPESWRFTIADGGCRLELLAELRGKELDDRHEVEKHAQLVGTAERHGAGCGAAEPDPRVDELLGEVADLRGEVGELRELAERQSAQLCEVLRLLHVPQGRRESDAPEVVEACGTGFDWNGER